LLQFNCIRTITNANAGLCSVRAQLQLEGGFSLYGQGDVVICDYRNPTFDGHCMTHHSCYYDGCHLVLLMFTITVQ